MAPRDAQQRAGRFSHFGLLYAFGWFYITPRRAHIYNYYPLHLNKSFHYGTEIGPDKWAVL
ncbi:Hypothetical predicted protein, partial [Xyrichtys novacula]